VISTETILDSCHVAVEAGDSYVGIASMRGKQGEDHLGCGFTGVSRDRRNLGVATALKARALAVAKEQVCLEANAGGGGGDGAMQRVNRRLGFEIEPAWITFGLAVS
jgi:GNAT superfamily N-acetyltransferase